MVELAFEGRGFGWLVACFFAWLIGLVGREGPPAAVAGVAVTAVVGTGKKAARNLC